MGKGYLRCTLIDYYSGEFTYIPTELYPILQDTFNENDVDKESLEYLISNQVIFEVLRIDEHSYIPRPMGYNSASHLDTLVVDGDELDISFLKKICADFVINNLVLEFSHFNNQNIEELLKLECNGIIFKFSNCDIPSDTLLKLNQDNIVTSIIFYERLQSQIESSFSDSEKIRFNSHSMNLNRFNQDSMVINYDFNLESFTYHAVFNKTLFLQNKTLYDSRLKSRVTQIDDPINNSLGSIWLAKKENCDTCCDCEFSPMCTDKRIPKFRSTDIKYFFDKECLYNPYIARWSHEEGFRSLVECNVTSDENGFSIDQQKLAEINNEIWGYE